MDAGETVFEYDSIGENFFIILNGEVSVNIPNPILKDMKKKYGRYLQLRDWYDYEF